jgi:hypothetical protein
MNLKVTAEDRNQSGDGPVWETATSSRGLQSLAFI